MMTHQESEEYLDSFINFEHRLGDVNPQAFKLDRVYHLLKALGDPQKTLKVVHVAGTKGKGSVCVLAAEILSRAGYRVGLYTSPHMNHYRERIRFLNRPGQRSSRPPDLKGVGKLGGSGDIFPDGITQDELSLLIKQVRPVIEEVRRHGPFGRITFFEVFTALAFFYFRQQKVDVAVLETGLGGRLDATNTADSIVAAVTSISLEHTHILGDTIGKIAGEKAGIIKDPRQKVVLGVQDPDAAEVLSHRCREWDICPLWIGQDITWKAGATDLTGQWMDIDGPGYFYRGVKLPLLGRHQQANAAMAVGIVECLKAEGFIIPPTAVNAGMREAFWPGRFEILRGEPIAILDVAHNGASALALAETLKEVLPERRVVAVVGVCEDKDWDAIHAVLSGVSAEIVLTKADHPRARCFDTAVAVPQAIEIARGKARREDVILVTGSVFVVAEARRYLSHFPKKPTGVI